MVFYKIVGLLRDALAAADTDFNASRAQNAGTAWHVLK